jgi:hypothetical protein
VSFPACSALFERVVSGEVVAPEATMAMPCYGAMSKSPRYATASSPSPVARILRDQRRRDMIASIAEWERASGPERVWWRRDARHRLAEWRRLYAIPERAAFQAAVQRSRA